METWESKILEKYCSEHIKEIHKVLISDCDGILTDGNLGYINKYGKALKMYGCHDHELINLLKAIGWQIIFVTNDKSGFDITKNRVQQLGCELRIANPDERANLVSEFCKNGFCVAFFGDSPSDLLAASKAHFRFSTANCFEPIKDYFQFISKHDGGHGGFAECAYELIKEFYYKYNNDKA